MEQNNNYNNNTIMEQDNDIKTALIDFVSKTVLTAAHTSIRDNVFLLLRTMMPRLSITSSLILLIFSKLLQRKISMNLAKSLTQMRFYVIF